MSQFRDLLRTAAGEVRDYTRTSTQAADFGAGWLLGLADRMEAASALESDDDVEREIDAFAHAITDSGPLTETFAPSFHQALDALQRRRKKQRYA